MPVALFLCYRDFLLLLKSRRWPTCKSRKNVKPMHAPSFCAMVSGAVWKCKGLLMPSRCTRRWKDLVLVINQQLAKHEPSLRFTSLQLNFKYPSKLHMDSGNQSPSYAHDWRAEGLLQTRRRGLHSPQVQIPTSEWRAADAKVRLARTSSSVSLLGLVFVFSGGRRRASS